MGINSYFTTTVNVVSYTKDQWGEVSGTTTTAVKCRVDWRSHKVITIAGHEVLSSAIVTFPPGQAISYEDRIQIDDVNHAIAAIRIPADLMDVSKEVHIV